MEDVQTDVASIFDKLQSVNAASPFNSWAGFELIQAGGGNSELAVLARRELMQHSGFLHAGVLGALVDTACGFAAASISGAVLASQYQVLCYKPAVGERFVARASVDRAGRRQLFASAQVFAVCNGIETLVAGGSAVPMVAA